MQPNKRTITAAVGTPPTMTLYNQTSRRCTVGMGYLIRMSNVTRLLKQLIRETLAEARCPDCGGAGSIDGILSKWPCEKCKQSGEVPDEPKPASKKPTTGSTGPVVTRADWLPYCMKAIKELDQSVWMDDRTLGWVLFHGLNDADVTATYDALSDALFEAAQDAVHKSSRYTSWMYGAGNSTKLAQAMARALKGQRNVAMDRKKNP